VRVAGDHALAVIAPHLPSADAIECRGRCVAERQRFIESDLLLLAVPIEEAHIGARDRAARRRENGRSGRNREVDPLVDPASVVARRAGEQLEVLRHFAAFDRQGKGAPDARVGSRSAIADIR